MQRAVMPRALVIGHPGVRCGRQVPPIPVTHSASAARVSSLHPAAPILRHSRSPVFTLIFILLPRRPPAQGLSVGNSRDRSIGQERRTGVWDRSMALQVLLGLQALI